jgi:MFS family permease
MLGDMDVNQRQLSYGLAVQVVGLAMGCLLLIPLTKKYGKRLTYILATLVMAGMSFWSAEMKTAVELYMTNLLYGLACSVNETVVQMTVSVCLSTVLTGDNRFTDEG